MLPQNHKVGQNKMGVMNPGGLKTGPAAKVGAAVGTGAKAAGSAIAGGARTAAGAVGSAAARVGHGTAQNLKHPVLAAKGGAAAVSNTYKKTFNDPRANGPKNTMATNLKNSPVKGAAKIVAGATGALGAAAFVAGAARPGAALKEKQGLKSDQAEKKMGGLSWSPPAKTTPARGPASRAPGAR